MGGGRSCDHVPAPGRAPLAEATRQGPSPLHLPIRLSIRLPLLLLAAALAGLLLAAAACPAAQAAPERITNFESRVEIRADGHATITETISVEARGKQIVHGIYRDLPDADPPFEIRQVLRDGKAEPWRTETISGGRRLFIGSAQATVRPGSHVYTLVYDARNLIAFLPQRDELYYNVTGNDWQLPIDVAGAWVTLPAGAQVLELDAWTGQTGSRDHNCTIHTVRGDPLFATTRPLGPGEGLTIGVAFAKGAVTPAPAHPSNANATADAAPASGRHLGLLAALAAGVLVLAYYAVVWRRVGRDPAKGPIIPRFAPPKGFSPAACRFVLHMGFDNTCLAAALLDMAVKGHLRILEPRRRTYAVQKVGPETSLSPGEAAVSRTLFARTERFDFTPANHREVRTALQNLQKSLRSDFMRAYFARNSAWLLPGILASLLGLAALIWLDTAPERRAFTAIMAVWLSAFASVTVLLAAHALHRPAGERGLRRLAPALGVAALLGLAAAFGFHSLLHEVGVPTVGAFLGLVLLNALFAHLLRAPTLRGRRVMDEIEGLRLYLAVAEQDRFEKLHPPDQTPEHFEKLLPYALALDVEHAWSQHFATTLDRAALDPDRGRPGWQPGWYSGTAFTGLHAAGFASDLSSGFASTIAAASSPGSGSSGGFGGGGGSSGGGSGGGGGGGW